MRAAYITDYQPLGLLKVAELARPALRPGEILVRVHAAGINPVDVKIWKGMLKPALKLRFPQVLGLDVSGLVVETGPSSRFKPGDEVFGTTPRAPGAFAEYAAVKESALALKPKQLNHEDAAGLPLVALTAWQALLDVAKLQAGEKIFIQAGGGGFGSFAVQLAKSHGGIVTTTASARHRPLLEQLGADQIVDYHDCNYEDVVRDHDVAIESIDGMLSRTMATVRRGGRVVSLIGPPDTHMLGELGVPRGLAWMLGNLASRRVRAEARARSIAYRAMFVRANGARLAQVAKLISDGTLRPVTDRIFTLERAEEALRYVASGHAAGKVVLRI